MEFPRILKKKCVEIPGVNKKRSGISRGIQEKNNVEFPWVLVFVLGISKLSHTIFQNFCRISRSESLFSLEFIWIKVTNLKFPGGRVGGVQKSISPTPIWFLSGIAQCDIFLFHVLCPSSCDFKSYWSFQN